MKAAIWPLIYVRYRELPHIIDIFQVLSIIGVKYSMNSSHYLATHSSSLPFQKSYQREISVKNVIDYSNKKYIFSRITIYPSVSFGCNL